MSMRSKRPNRIRASLIMLGAAVAMAQSAPTLAWDTAKMIAVNPQTLKFAPIPNMPSCVSYATLRGDPRTGPAWVLLKLASGCRVPKHWHTPNEDVLIVSGAGTMTMEDGRTLPFVPGAYASLPSHHTHQASCTRACLLFTAADAAYDIHYVDANGEEVPLDQALKQSAKAKGTKGKKK